MKIKFHSFDALRFFSFLIVFFSHLPYNHFPTVFLSLFQGRGNIGVYFFFVLSGFLITYILLVEKVENNSIHFKNFILRRILRIWPLFYTMIIFAFLSSFLIQLFHLNSSDVGYSPNWLLSCLFLENYQVILHNKFANIPPLSVMWSLCVEEHFYIIWGLVLFFCKKKQIPKFILLFIIVSIISKYIFTLYDLKQLEILTNFDFFMYGAIPAYLIVYHKDETESKIQKTSLLLKYFTLTIAISIILFSKYTNLGVFSFIESSLYGLIFGLVIIIFLPQENPLKISSKNVFSKLGKYTYGLYLTHIICIILIEKIFVKYHLNLKNNFTIYICSTLLLSIICSYFSYNFIEKPFLNLKRKF